MAAVYSSRRSIESFLWYLDLYDWPISNCVLCVTCTYGMFLQYCTAVSKELPGDLVALLKWTMEKVNSYFHGISNRRWIPRPEAQVLVQDCHDMVEPWLNLWEASRFHVFRNCCPGHEFAVRKGFLASLTGVLVVVGLCLPRPRSCTCNKRLGFLVAYFPAYPAFFFGWRLLAKGFGWLINLDVEHKWWWVLCAAWSKNCITVHGFKQSSLWTLINVFPT